MKKLKPFILNFGPQHPAAHGVLRLILQLDGEIIVGVDPHIGLLHRGTEKLVESRTFLQSLPYLDRLDYVSMMSQEHCYALTVEKILGLIIPVRASYIRVIFLEITRILNHLLAITTHALDVGALTPFLWGFEEREKFLEFYERVSGARLHASFIQPGGVMYDLPLNFCNDLYNTVLKFQKRIVEIEDLLTFNRIWSERLSFVGCITTRDAIQYSLSGVMLRSTGIGWDIRKDFSYEIYNLLKFMIPVGFNGDCYDRYLLRVEEIKQSLIIIKQCLVELPSGSILADNYKYVQPTREMFKFSMESLIHHFKYYSVGFSSLSNYVYSFVEAPKGEFGVHLLTDGLTKPYRCHFRSPGFFHLQSFEALSRGLMLADVVTLIGSSDLVFGEIDR